MKVLIIGLFLIQALTGPPGYIPEEHPDSIVAVSDQHSIFEACNFQVPVLPQVAPADKVRINHFLFEDMVDNSVRKSVAGALVLPTACHYLFVPHIHSP